ncbi:Protein TPX2 [Capsicum baccatum]|uniref:Protein TPX2 n=1 Tax=Capsicum baccatum TaxID=33114 RepID=A0A2G2UZ51_CAPBA|nr:Protein TPX2 [Capsicum baccatum]
MAAAKSTAATVFVKVKTLKTGSTAATKSTVKVVESNTVKATGGRGGRLSVNSRPPARISECLIGDETALSSSLLVTNKMYARETVPLFVSIAEMVKKFQSNIREMSLPPMSNSTALQRKHKLILTRPKQPEFATAKRVRSAEVEKEELEKVPKFKARPLNKKIFESKGVLGMFLNTKRQVTVPQEFHFATDKRILPPANVADELLFKAQPVLTEDPIPVPEKVRKPLTEVQDFKLRVDNRSLDRAEFDKKIKQKEMMHKRYIEETESARMIEEEKALKQLRRTLVPHARPVPKFDHPFLPQKSSKQVTKPRSPKLQIVKRKERKATTACPYAAVSTAASQMR